MNNCRNAKTSTDCKNGFGRMKSAIFVTITAAVMLHASVARCETPPGSSTRQYVQNTPASGDPPSSSLRDDPTSPVRTVLKVQSSHNFNAEIKLASPELRRILQTHPFSDNDPNIVRSPFYLWQDAEVKFTNLRLLTANESVARVGADYQGGPDTPGIRGKVQYLLQKSTEGWLIDNVFWLMPHPVHREMIRQFNLPADASYVGPGEKELIACSLEEDRTGEAGLCQRRFYFLEHKQLMEEQGCIDLETTPLTGRLEWQMFPAAIDYRQTGSGRAKVEFVYQLVLPTPRCIANVDGLRSKTFTDTLQLNSSSTDDWTKYKHFTVTMRLRSAKPALTAHDYSAVVADVASLLRVQPPLEYWDRLPVPKRIGECNNDILLDITGRFEGEKFDPRTSANSPSSGTRLRFSSELKLVSYGIELVAVGAKSLDPVQVCLVSIPQDCPIGDNRGRMYRVTNKRTKQSSELADSQHQCGGA